MLPVGTTERKLADICAHCEQGTGDAVAALGCFELSCRKAPGTEDVPIVERVRASAVNAEKDADAICVVPNLR